MAASDMCADKLSRELIMWPMELMAAIAIPEKLCEMGARAHGAWREE